MKTHVKRLLRSVGLDVTKLPESRLPLAQRLNHMILALGYRIRRLPSAATLDAGDGTRESRLIKHYLDHGRVPHSPGYNEYRVQFLRRTLSDEGLLARFAAGEKLPPGYGFRLDERCVEYPWFFSSASESASCYLDAGSAMNHAYVLAHPFWKGKKLTIVTLAAESECYCQHGISYQFEDLRNLPFRDSWFDEIACLSTLEHVGMEASIFTKRDADTQHDTESFKTGLLEMWRVLRPSGRLLLTVPFGLYQDCGWFQQFDASLLEASAKILNPVERNEKFYRYSPEGWQIADKGECNACEYSQWSSDPKVFPPTDYAANARAVACCAWKKG